MKVELLWNKRWHLSGLRGINMCLIWQVNKRQKITCHFMTNTLKPWSHQFKMPAFYMMGGESSRRQNQNQYTNARSVEKNVIYLIKLYNTLGYQIWTVYVLISNINKFTWYLNHDNAGSVFNMSPLIRTTLRWLIGPSGQSDFDGSWRVYRGWP